MAFIVFIGIFVSSMIVLAMGPVTLDAIGPHVFAVAILATAALAVFTEWSRNRFSILCFPLIGSLLFIWGLFGPYYQLEIVGEYIYYHHLREDLISQSMAIALVAFSCMWLTYFLPPISRQPKYNPVVFVLTNHSLSQSVFVVSLGVWVVLCLIHVGGIGSLFYNDQPRAYDQFYLSSVRRNIGLAVRFLAVILGFMSVTLFVDRKKGKLSWASWFVVGFWFVLSLSQFDRGKFLEVAIVILGAYIVATRRFTIRQAWVVLVFGLMSAAILVNANGRLYGVTGLLAIPDAVAYGVEHKIKDPYSIFPEVGALVMTTVAVELHDAGIRRPIRDVVYQINPMPSFMMPPSWRPDFFIERLLGTFGSSGTPMPLLAFGYMSFGALGCVFFGGLGLYFRALSARIRYGKRHSNGMPVAIGILIYPVSLAGLMYTFAHGEPRGSIRMVFYAYIILLLLRFLFPNRFVRLNSVISQ